MTSDAPPGLIYNPSTLDGALRQGEIISDLHQPFVTADSIVSARKRNPAFGLIPHPLVIVMSQDCDLDLEFLARNSPPSTTTEGSKKPVQITNVLFCDVFPEDVARSNIGGSDIWKRVKNNKDERYQYLRFVSLNEDAQGNGFPSYLVVDFRQYFTLTVAEAYARLKKGAKRHCRLISPYMEHLSARFSYYLSRIALPEDH